MPHFPLDVVSHPGFAGPPLSPTNQPDAMALPDNLSRIVDNLPFGCTVNGLLGYLQTRVTQAHDLYLVARHLDNFNLESGLLTHSKALRIYVGISDDHWYANSRQRPKIAPHHAAEALAWAATRMTEKYQQRAITRLETGLPSASVRSRAQALFVLNQDFERLSEASRLQVVDKLMTPMILRDLPDRVVLPLQQRVIALRQVVPQMHGARLDGIGQAMTRTMHQNLAAHLPASLPDPATFHMNRAGPHLLRNIATSINHASSPAQQIAALDLLTPARLVGLLPADREEVRGTLHAAALRVSESGSAV